MRTLLILSMWAFGMGCSPAAPKCSLSTCSGCCDAAGACQPGTVESGCGSGGLACTQCGADSFCNVGFCTPRGSSNLGGGGGTTGGGAGGGSSGGGGGTSACGPQTCGGCCSDGVCQVGNQASSCGSGGQVCSACSGACTDNQCAGSTCNASNCQGCCNGNRCETGLTTTTCGAGGATCNACGAGQTCSSGRCSGGSTCNSENCPDGCCQGNVCQVGTATSACGGNGATCGVCASGQTCSAGRCNGGSTCNATTCPDGCCAGSVCQPGRSTSACGAGGSACATCGSGQTCNGTQCVSIPPTCNATTCPTGCCSENVCLPGTSADGCGTGGGVCAICGSAQSCNGTQCVSPSTCNVTTCPGGCCQGNVCQAGTMNAACGTGGATCASCGSNTACDGTSCVASCNASTCPSGCCQGNVCQLGTTSAACGGNGASCSVCASSQTCSSRLCSGGTLAGDTCDTAVLLTLPFTVSQSLVGYGNDFITASTTCSETQGIDRVTAVTVPAGQRLTATVTPTVATFDPVVSFVMGPASACTGANAVCAATMDTGNANDAETLGWTNTTGSSQTVFIIVGDYSATGIDGAYSLSASVGSPVAGESCMSPINASSGVAVSRTPSSYANDYQGTGTGCLTPSVGPDFVLAYTVQNNQGLTVTATPASGLDVSLNFATSLAACGSRTCVAAASANGAGVAETLAWNNTTGSTVTVFVIIDTPTSPVGAVSVVGTVGALIGCGPSTCANGCCQGNTCVAGNLDTACGTNGTTCSACASPNQCNSSQVCSASSLSSGSACTASSQCYQPVLGTAECRTTWPGGYCTGTCFLTEQSCGGILLNSGWCTPAGECLLECAGPGTGQSTCRSGYVCDFSNGAGSQGVCIPKCQQVACASGTCNTSGYCR